MSESVCLVHVEEYPGRGMKFGGIRHRNYKRLLSERKCDKCGCPMDKHFRPSGCEGCKEENKQLRRELGRQQWLEENGYV